MNNHHDSKFDTLKSKGLLNSKADKVTDDLFQNYQFFDPRDLLKVKYEMIRRVQKDGWSITRSAHTFGFSRTAFYQIQNTLLNQGISGLIPLQRGPKSAHKLTENIVDFVSQKISEQQNIRSLELSSLIQKEFGITVHPRSIERALQKRKKKRRNRNGQ